MSPVTSVHTSLRRHIIWYPWCLTIRVWISRSRSAGLKIGLLIWDAIGTPSITGPLIRRESVYANDMMEQRKHLFNILFYFTRRLDIYYICACVKKSECEDSVDMTAKLSRSIALSLTKHTEFFGSYDRIIVYYDNGQVELTKIITTLFATRFPNVGFPT